MITIRPTHPDDLEKVMQMVADAQRRFRCDGVDQWQDGYPTLAAFEADIAAQNSYVGVLEGEVVLCGCLSFDGEPTYEKIYEGAWLNEAPYGVVHRLVVADTLRGRGLAGDFFRFAFDQCRKRDIGNMRVDTHRNNLPMQRLLHRIGFQPCGRIVLESGANREAYQLIFSR